MSSKSVLFRYTFLLFGLFVFLTSVRPLWADCKGFIPPPPPPSAMVCNEIVFVTLDGNNGDHSQAGLDYQFTNSNGYKPFNRGVWGTCQGASWDDNAMGVQGKHVLLEVRANPPLDFPGNDPNADRAKFRILLGPNLRFEDGSREIAADIPRAPQFKKYLNVVPADCPAAIEASKEWHQKAAESAHASQSSAAGSCQIKSVTEAPEPPDHARKKLGVGETVSLTTSGQARWSLAGAGTLSTNNGVLFTASDRSGSSTVTATTAKGSCSITFTTVEPTGVRLVKSPGSSLCHHRNVPDIGFEAIRYLAPSDVSFRNVEFREDHALGIGTGVFSFTNGTDHDQTFTPLPVRDTVGVWGSLVSGLDTVYSGYPTVIDARGRRVNAPEPYRPGIEITKIPNQFRVGNGEWKTFSSVEQKVEFSSDLATLIASKGGQTVSVKIYEATTLFDIPTNSKTCTE